MAGITAQTVNRIKDRISPVQVIEYYTGGSGQRNRWTCPFHDDRHPSITVKGTRWTCWACGANGDVIDFTRRFYGVGFYEAIAKLGRDFGVPVETEPTGRMDPSERRRQILEDIDRKNRREYRAWLDDRIDTLTICRRVLMQHNAPAWEIQMYDDELDSLTAEREECR